MNNKNLIILITANFFLKDSFYIDADLTSCITGFNFSCVTHLY